MLGRDNVVNVRGEIYVICSKSYTEEKWFKWGWGAGRSHVIGDFKWVLKSGLGH